MSKRTKNIMVIVVLIIIAYAVKTYASKSGLTSFEDQVSSGQFQVNEG
jgi:hypothetical protein